MLGGEAPPNICRQKHGHKKKRIKHKKTKHEINFWNHDFFTIYTTHAICFIGTFFMIRSRHLKKFRTFVIKTDTNVFDSFKAQHFLWHKEQSFFLMTKIRHLNLKNLRTFCHKKRTLIIFVMICIGIGRAQPSPIRVS